jgi:GLPGLI family protein
MKKTTFIVLVALLFTFTCKTFAQKGEKVFKGVINFEISFPDNKFDAATLAQLPKLMIMTVGEAQSKTVLDAGMFSQSTITDANTKTSVTLMDIMGQKMLIKKTKEEIEKEIEKNPSPKIVLSDETKEIAGYTCKKAEITTMDPDQGDKEITFTVYYSEELGNEKLNFEGLFRGLNGLPLEYNIDANSMKMKFTATSVKKQKVTDKDFEIPEGYKEVTKEELQNMFGGGQ